MHFMAPRGPLNPLETRKKRVIITRNWRRLPLPARIVQSFKKLK